MGRATFCLTACTCSYRPGSGMRLTRIHDTVLVSAMRSSTVCRQTVESSPKADWSCRYCQEKRQLCPSQQAHGSCLLASLSTRNYNSPRIKRSVKTSATEPLHFFTSHTTYHPPHPQTADMSAQGGSIQDKGTLYSQSLSQSQSQLSAPASAAIVVAFPNAS